MDELKLLVEMVASLPHTALWVIAFFFAYKVVFIGSVYGVIRFCAGRLFDWLSTRKAEYKEVRPLIEGHCVFGTVDALLAQILRIRGNKPTGYIHNNNVDWLRAAIDAQIAKDAESEASHASK